MQRNTQHADGLPNEFPNVWWVIANKDEQDTEEGNYLLMVDDRTIKFVWTEGQGIGQEEAERDLRGKGVAESIIGMVSAVIAGGTQDSLRGRIHSITLASRGDYILPNHQAQGGEHELPDR